MGTTLLATTTRAWGVPRKLTARPKIQLLVGDISATTQARYTNKVEALERFIINCGGPSLGFMVKAGALQAVLVWTQTFLQVGYDTQLLSLSDAANLLCGLKRWFQLQLISVHLTELNFDGVLKPLWSLYGHWKKVEPYDFRVPVPELLVWALVGQALLIRQPKLVLFILVGFFCLLRPGEILGLRHCDFWHDGGPLAVLRIQRPKIKHPQVQHVLVEQQWLIRLGHLFFDPLQGSTLLFDWNENQLLKRWTLLFQLLQLPQRPFEDLEGFSQGRFTPAGLRAGGATFDYLRYQNLHRLMWRGRWHSLQVLEHYVQLGIYTYYNQQTFHHMLNTLEELRRIAMLAVGAPEDPRPPAP